MEPAADCAVTPPVDDAGELQRKWADVVKRVVAAQPSRGALLQSARAQHDDGEMLVVGFPKGSNFAIKMIGRPDSQAVVQPIVCAVFGKRVVSYVMDGGPQPGAAPAGSPTSAGTSGQPVASNPGAAAAAAGSAPAAVSSPAAAEPTASAPVAAASSTAVPAEVSAADQTRASVVASTPADASVSAATGPASVDPVPAASATHPTAERDSAASAVVPESASVSAGSAPVSKVAHHGAAPNSGAPAPAVDQTSGPTVLPERDVEADRRAWEEQVPYDDAMIAAYAEDDEELPPFAAPAASASASGPASVVPAASAVAPAPAASASRAAVRPWERTSTPASGPTAQPSSTPAPTPAAPAPAASSGSSASPAADLAHPFSHEAEGVDAPQTVEEAKAMLGTIFGAGVVFKDVEE